MQPEVRGDSLAFGNYFIEYLEEKRRRAAFSAFFIRFKYGTAFDDRR